jgi:DNA polymerase-3 subunit delta'
MSEQAGVLEGAIPPVLNDRLFGHEDAERFLAQAHKGGKMHHALLIEGPQGIGKATLAFRFANHILTHSNPALAPDMLADPDIQSAVSRQLASGASHNLLHLSRPTDEKTGKVKSAITVDEVRRAGRFFAQTTGSDSWRVVIVDPADDLNRNAANAILKMLEEPPKRSIFLVLSHAPGKLLPTIRSRCMPLKLSPLSDGALSSALDHLDINLTPEKRELLVASAGGSVSQALKLLNYGGSDIVEAFNSIMETKGPAARKVMHKLADVLAQKDSDVILGFFTEHVTDYLISAARQSAMRGDLPRADIYSRLSSSLTEKINVAQAYNLDKKQTVISVLEELHALS